MYTPAPQPPIPVYITGAIILLYLLYRSRWGRALRNPKYASLLIIVPTLMLLPFQAYLSYDFSAYESGSNQGYGEWSLEPNETIVIHEISNWHTKVGLMVYVEPIQLTASLYLVDENLPDVRFLEQNCSSEEMSGFQNCFFSLPYLYTSYPLIANWSIYLSNPNLNETVTVFLLNPDSMIIPGDPILSARLSLIRQYTIPSAALVILWVSVSLFTIATYQREDEEFSIGPILGASVCIIAYLFTLAPIGGWAAMTINMLGFLIGSTIVCVIFAYALRQSTPQSPRKESLEIQEKPRLESDPDDAKFLIVVIVFGICIWLFLALLYILWIP
ncbi:MAG: hypothetical protein ACW960_12040 [Candidatus Thorarchaeota archaeon]|jgi:hypothetical protein